MLVAYRRLNLFLIFSYIVIWRDIFGCFCCDGFTLTLSFHQTYLFIESVEMGGNAQKDPNGIEHDLASDNMANLKSKK